MEPAWTERPHFVFAYREIFDALRIQMNLAAVVAEPAAPSHLRYVRALCRGGGRRMAKQPRAASQRIQRCAG